MRATTPGDVLRSLAFYTLFYGGSFLLALASAVTELLGGRGTCWLAEAWARLHRFATVHVLRIKVVVDGPVPSGAVLVAGKHESFFEAIDLPVLLHRPAPFAKAELLRLPLWGKVGQRYGLVAVERDQGAKALRAMRAAAGALAQAGRPLVIFPEGTRVPHGECPPLQAGFAGIYKLVGLPVVPMAVDSGRCYQRRWKRPGTIRIRFGETIPPGLLRDEAEARVREAINVLNDGIAA